MPCEIEFFIKDVQKHFWLVTFCIMCFACRRMFVSAKNCNWSDEMRKDMFDKTMCFGSFAELCVPLILEVHFRWRSRGIPTSVRGGSRGATNITWFETSCCSTKNSTAHSASRHSTQCLYLLIKRAYRCRLDEFPLLRSIGLLLRLVSDSSRHSIHMWHLEGLNCSSAVSVSLINKNRFVMVVNVNCRLVVFYGRQQKICGIWSLMDVSLQAALMNVPIHCICRTPMIRNWMAPHKASQKVRSVSFHFCCSVTLILAFCFFCK